MKVLHVHAHFDDFEFVAAGTFELWRRRLAGDFRGRIIVCTDGRSGHHFRTRKETAAVRRAEQIESARIGGYEFHQLTRPDGSSFGEARTLTTELLAALWKSIRDFEPDYLLCPPLPVDTVAGVHPDHVTVAEAIRRMAYMINVPHAFLDEYPVPDETVSRWVKTPVILNTYDGYQAGSNRGDLVVDVAEALEVIAAESWCHQCQIREWLPWIGRHQMPVADSLEEWREVLRRRFARQARELALPEGSVCEVFTLTAWGELPQPGQLEADFPSLMGDPSRTERLMAKLRRWSA